MQRIVDRSEATAGRKRCPLEFRRCWSEYGVMNPSDPSATGRLPFRAPLKTLIAAGRLKVIRQAAARIVRYFLKEIPHNWVVAWRGEF